MADRADSILAVAVTPSRLVAVFGWVVVASGAISVAFGVLWFGLSWLLAVLTGGLLFLTHCLLERRSRHGRGSGVLRVVPGGAWRWSDGHEVTLDQAWQHVFGLTLTFNYGRHPHNPSERLTLTIWRSSVPPPIYRKLSVAVAWQRMQPRRTFIREPV
ncbi:MAG: hypothetical protein IT507_01725 [Burkholderiaceae bacterium]|nr:hypothetical protein [Burkholderiaceae bacterium]